MPAEDFQKDSFRSTPVIGILRGYHARQIKGLVDRYLSAGFTCLEVTWNSPDAGNTIQMLADTYGDDLLLGAGTILTINDLDQSLDAGARFVVTPIVQPEVIASCVRQQIPVFPGAFTPTEVYQAWNLGATAVKLFPAEFGGLAYLKSIQAPLTGIPLIPTGGVSEDNISDFLDAGVFAVGMGSQLFPRKFVLTSDWTRLELHFSQLKRKIMEWNEKGK